MDKGCASRWLAPYRGLVHAVHNHCAAAAPVKPTVHNGADRAPDRSASPAPPLLQTLRVYPAAAHLAKPPACGSRRRGLEILSAPRLRLGGNAKGTRAG